MSENPTDIQGPSTEIQEDALDACRLIRSEVINPLGWFFPTKNACVSCIILTGSHPEIMAASCPKVIAYLSEQTQFQTTEDKK